MTTAPAMNRPGPRQNANRVLPAVDAPVSQDTAGQPVEGVMLNLTRGLIWVYLILWIVEGSLRKWYLVPFSDVLLVVRDPVVLLIYVCAVSCRTLTFNLFTGAVVLLGILSMIASVLVNPTGLVVAAFGFRANFLHLPLIFVMARALRPLDLKRMAWLLLILALPMAMVMAKQYRSDIDDWWNLGAGGGRMIIVLDRKVRPSGLFSFVSGPIIFYTATAAFLMAAISLRGWLKWWIALPAAAGTILACAVAGSRSLLGAVVVTLTCFLIGCVAFPRSLKYVAKLAAIGLGLFLVVSTFAVFQEGSSSTADRFVGATQNEGGLWTTVYARLIEPVFVSVGSVFEADPLGRGLGLGTVAGAILAGGKGFFGENEWLRTVSESGPFLGLAFMFTRAGLGAWLLLQSFRAARAGNLLPLALWGSGVQILVLGQFGQPTTLGGAVLLTGFCLAALNIPYEETRFSPTDSAAPQSAAETAPADATIQTENGLKPGVFSLRGALPRHDGKPIFGTYPKRLGKATDAGPAPEPATRIPGFAEEEYPSVQPGAFAIHSGGSTKVPGRSPNPRMPISRVAPKTDPIQGAPVKPGAFVVRPGIKRGNESV